MLSFRHNRCEYTCECAARRRILDDADLGQLEVTACNFLITNDVIEYPRYGLCSFVWNVVIENPGAGFWPAHVRKMGRPQREDLCTASLAALAKLQAPSNS